MIKRLEMGVDDNQPLSGSFTSHLRGINHRIPPEKQRNLIMPRETR